MTETPALNECGESITSHRRSIRRLGEPGSLLAGCGYQTLPGAP
jgi:hypothetical protein